MSYDLSVFAPNGLPPAGLLDVVNQVAGLRPLGGRDLADGKDGSFRVGRGARDEYCFTVDGPFEVEIEDLPEQVTAAVVGAKVLYQILVEGSSEAAVPHAVRFARKLAKTLQGVVVDDQIGEAWPVKSQRTPPKPDSGKRIDIVEMRWYFLADDQPADLPEIYLQLARKYLPEALPKRFGNFEPLQGNLERDGDQAFSVLPR